MLGATDPPADHETHVPGPPYIACQCATNPVTISWAPDTRRVAQPEAIHMYLGSRPGKRISRRWNMGLSTSWSGSAQPGANYYVHIRAVNSFGGNFSAQVVVSVGNPTPVLSGTLTGRDLTLRWTGSPTATLFASTSPLFATYGSVAVSGNVISFRNVAPGVDHLILWTGQWSNILAATVP